MPKRILQGTVVSNAADKTITVKVTQRLSHKTYGKIIQRTRKYAAHDEKNSFNVGDTVSIEECRPISKSKTWKVIEAES